MRTVLQRARPRADVPTSSLADIAFLLLIFFLVTTVFDEEKGLPLLLPDGSKVDVAPDNVLHLLARADGVVEVRAGNSPEGITVHVREIRRIWREAVLHHPGLIAAVHVEADASYRRMVDVLDELQSVGAERISLQLANR
jgi:biopolymer transport protein ExbD